MGLKKREKRVRGVAEDFQQKWDKAREEKRIMEQPDTDFFYIDKSPAKKKLDRVERKRRLYGDSVGIESVSLTNEIIVSCTTLVLHGYPKSSCCSRPVSENCGLLLVFCVINFAETV